MTVIVAQLQADKIIHATDSLLSARESDGRHTRASGSGASKIFECVQYNGAFSWWGAAETRSWEAKSWLIELNDRLKELQNPLTVDVFAGKVAEELQYIHRSIPTEKARSHGMHFTVFERVGQEYIPELFLITNYAGMEYGSGPRFVAQRQTFHTLSGNSDCDFERHHEESYRMEVLRRLKLHPLTYSNGQPRLFARYLANYAHLSRTPQTKLNFWDERPYRICKDIIAMHKEESPPSKRTISAPIWQLKIQMQNDTPVYDLRKRR